MYGASRRVRLSVVVPAYNEAAAIASSLAEIIAAVEQLTDDYEIIVVDDGSSDGTARCARLCAELYPGRIAVIESATNHGKGASLVLGASYACGERIAFLDADLDLHPSLLHGLNARMDETGFDAVIGSKRHPESDVQVPALRRVLSAGYFFIVWLLFGLPLRDTQTGIKIFKREILHAVLPRLCVKRFAFDLELLVNIYRAGGRIADAPVKIRSQRLAQRIRYHDVKTIFIDTLAVFYRARILRWYDGAPKRLNAMTDKTEPVVSYGRAVARTSDAGTSVIEAHRGEAVPAAAEGAAV
jgi:glycosyltransferase involved in cell wall biosynthesis